MGLAGDLGIMMRHTGFKRRASICLGALGALVVAACGVESPTPAELRSAPLLRPQGEGGGCSRALYCRQDETPLQCCCKQNANGCDCPHCNASSICRNGQCIDPPPTCAVSADCAGLQGTLSCQDGYCLPTGCVSNDECSDAGQVCQEDLGTCVPALKDDGDPPGCSATGASAGGGALISAIAALALAVARRRARHA